MDCCLLSDREVGRLTHYHLLPNHSEHIHISAEAAIQGIKSEKYEVINLRDGRYAVTERKVYFLARKRSGYLDTIQRVKSNHITELKPIR